MCAQNSNSTSYSHSDSSNDQGSELQPKPQSGGHNNSSCSRSEHLLMRVMARTADCTNSGSSSSGSNKRLECQRSCSSSISSRRCLQDQSRFSDSSSSSTCPCLQLQQPQMNGSTADVGTDNTCHKTTCEPLRMPKFFKVVTGGCDLSTTGLRNKALPTAALQAIAYTCEVTDLGKASILFASHQ